MLWRWECLPFNEGLCVQSGKLDTHDGAGDELLHGVGWLGDDCVDIAVFEAIKVGFDRVLGVPWCGEGSIVGLTFSR